MNDATLFQLPQPSTCGENRHQRYIIRLNLQSHHLTEEFNGLVTKFQVTIPCDHGPPGYFISDGHFVEQLARAGDLAGFDQPINQGVVGDDVSVGTFAEQLVGIVDSIEDGVNAYEGVEGVQMG